MMRISAGDHDGVVSADPERVGHHGVDVSLTRLVGDVVEVALRIGMLVVDRWRDGTTVDRQHASNELHRPGRAEQVAHHGLRGTHGYLPGARAEHLLDGQRFGAVVVRGAGAVGVDVVDLVWGHPRVRQSVAHAAGGAVGLGVGLGDVGGVGAHTGADPFAVYAGGGALL